MTGERGETREELLEALEAARQRIAELEELDRERIEAEKALVESERRIRAVLDQTFQFIGLMTPDGVLIEANRTSLKFGGLDDADVIGRRFWETPWWDHSPELRKKVEDGIRTAASGELVRFEVWHPTPDGGIVYLDVSLKPVLDEAGEVVYVIPEGRDITERKRADEDIRKLALAVEYSSQLINMASLDGQMIFLNRAGSEMLGVEPDEVEHTNIMQVIPEHLVDLVGAELLPALMNGETWKGDLQYRNLKTGEIVDVHAITYTVPDPETGEPLFLANVSLDLTELKAAERERQELQAQIQHTQKLESLGVLAGGIAHDFNNLLAGILGNAELALMQLAEDSGLRKNLVGIRKASVQAADLCKQMLAYSGRGRFVTEVIDPASVVEETAQMLRASISKKVSLTFDFADDTKAIEADAAQLSQVILNLITNAAESIGDGRGVIAVRTGTSFCDRERLQGAFLDEEPEEGEYTFVEVNDTGEGIDDEALSRIFDPFFTTKFTGRGLGLSAVLGIIRGHGGSVEVASTPGEGTRFTVLFPAVDASASTRREEVETPPSWQGEGTVLLVDDEEVVRDVGVRMLERLGFDVLTAVDGRVALEEYREHRERIVVVLLDLTMPEMDGQETLGELRKMDGDVPVIICSGYNEQEVTKRFSGDEIAGFLEKPIHMGDLAAKLKVLLG